MYGLDVRDIYNAVFVFDFGFIVADATNPNQLYLMTTLFDMGTIASPSAIGIDAGSLI